MQIRRLLNHLGRSLPQGEKMRNGDARRAPVVASLLTSAIILLSSIPAAVAAEVQASGFDGDGAEAVFESFEGCAKRTAIVRPLDSKSRDNATGAAEVSSLLVHLLMSDPCSDTFDSRIGRVNLAPEDFRARGDLAYASLTVQTELRDWVTGQIVPLDLDLTWRADGELRREANHSRVRYPDGTTWITRIAGSMRHAVATGSLSDGTYDYAARGASTSANISNTRGGFVIATVPPPGGPD